MTFPPKTTTHPASTDIIHRKTQEENSNLFDFLYESIRYSYGNLPSRHLKLSFSFLFKFLLEIARDYRYPRFQLIAFPTIREAAVGGSATESKVKDNYRNRFLGHWDAPAVKACPSSGSSETSNAVVIQIRLGPTSFLHYLSTAFIRR